MFLLDPIFMTLLPVILVSTRLYLIWLFRDPHVGDIYVLILNALALMIFAACHRTVCKYCRFRPPQRIAYKLALIFTAFFYVVLGTQI